VDVTVRSNVLSSCCVSAEADGVYLTDSDFESAYKSFSRKVLFAEIIKHLIF
jgi:hypothetical protein